MPKQVWQAEDGTQFDNEEACLLYEKLFEELRLRNIPLEFGYYPDGGTDHSIALNFYEFLKSTRKCLDFLESVEEVVAPNEKMIRQQKEKANRDAQIKEELKENFPYKVIAIDNAEADDIIATIVKMQTEDKYLIISGDKDFKQLQKYSNVSQYSPIQKHMVVEDNPTRYLHEQIIKGDRSDGIPNILSADDVFITKTKQSPITKKKLEEWSQIDDIPLGSETKKYYNRNKKLIDLDQIPNAMVESIINSYNDYEVPSRSKLLPYFIDNKLKSLIEHINDF